MNIIDSVLLVLLFLFALRGYFKGLFRESFSLLGLVAGFALSLRYDDALAKVIAPYGYLPQAALKPLSFVGLFALIYLGFSLVGYALHRWARSLLLYGVDRAGGIVVGAGKGAAVLALLVFLLSVFPLLPRAVREQIKNSSLARPLAHAAGDILKTQKEHVPWFDSRQEKLERTESL
ncbi:MAG TPA: CvpA family protein [Candidatus Acidoferrales bacterium]|nr:CvpA family protein [Candidatus Acidoferrales bacterium]